MDHWTMTAIAGVARSRLASVADSRGAFTELWRASLTSHLTGEPFVQSNRSQSAENVLRGMHFHLRQTDLWIVTHGRALVAISDLRPLADRSGGVETDTLEMGMGDCILIPKRVAHGFLALEPMELIYFVTKEYDGSDELGFAWDDPTARIPWPISEPMLSDRDALNPPLKEAIERLRSPESAR